MSSSHSTEFAANGRFNTFSNISVMRRPQQRILLAIITNVMLIMMMTIDQLEAFAQSFSRYSLSPSRSTIRFYSTTDIPTTTTNDTVSSTPASSTSYISPIQQTNEEKLRRKELLKRDGNFFRLDKNTGIVVEFGAAANLVTQLEEPSKLEPSQDFNNKIVEEWLLEDNGRNLAKSIWEESLLDDLGNGLYSLQTMPLQFVSLQVQPQVKIQMWTQPAGKTKTGKLLPPIFKVQSTSFEPNVKVLSPGKIASMQTINSMFTAESLGIELEVVGDLRPTNDAKGVEGKICFQTKGKLPPPLRIIPQQILEMAANTINDTITKFAISSFQYGAIQKYNEYKETKYFNIKEIK